MATLPPSLPSKFRLQVQSELKTGETLLWAGLPRAVSYRKTLFGVGMLLLGAAVMVMIDHKRNPSLRTNFPVYVVPFLLLALLGALNPLLSRGVWTLYVVTDRRAIVFNRIHFGSPRVDSYPPERLRELSIFDCGDGSGDLVFARRSYADGNTHSDGFLRVEDVYGVDRLIREKLHGKHLLD